MEYVAEAVRLNPHILKLDLSRCGAGSAAGMKGGDRAAAALRAMLAGNHTLTSLNLSSNAMGDKFMQMVLEGAVSAAQASLSELDISSTGAGRLSVPPLVALLTSGFQLQRLGLSSLSVPAASWPEALLPALARCSSLVALDLSHNSVGAGTEAGLAALVGLDSLRVVDLCGLGLPRDGWAVLGAAMTRPEVKVEMLILDVDTGKRVLEQLKLLKRAAKKGGAKGGGGGGGGAKRSVGE